MHAKEYLMQYQRQQRLIANRIAERDRWKNIAMSVSVGISGNEIPSLGGNGERMADAVCEIADLDTEITEAIRKAMEIERDIMKRIEALPVEEYDLLHKLYIQCVPFGDLPGVLNKSKRTVARLHGSALKRIQASLDADA